MLLILLIHTLYFSSVKVSRRLQHCHSDENVHTVIPTLQYCGITRCIFVYNRYLINPLRLKSSFVFSSDPLGRIMQN